MLNIEGADDIDARLSYLQNVLIAFPVAAQGHIGMGHLVHDGNFRTPGQHRVQVHFFHRDPPIGKLLPGNHLKIAYQLRSFGPAMGLDVGQDHVHAALLQGMGLFQHAHGLAHAGGKTEVNLQPAALGAFQQIEEVLGAVGVGVHRQYPLALCSRGLEDEDQHAF